VRLDMLLQILRSLERLAAKVALMRLEGDVDADMRGDVITLDSCDAARTPVTSQVEVVCALAADVAFTYVLLCGLLVQGMFTCWRSETYVKSLGSLVTFTTVQPLASE
jgi:hypothetical protein